MSGASLRYIRPSVRQSVSPSVRQSVSPSVRLTARLPVYSGFEITQAFTPPTPIESLPAGPGFTWQPLSKTKSW